jgi:hypothetical protein
MIMTYLQMQTIERTLVGLSEQDKLELVEHLVHSLRAEKTQGREMQMPRTPITEQEFKMQLLESGLMTSLPTPLDTVMGPAFQPVKIEGEPLSETIIRERR